MLLPVLGVCDGVDDGVVDGRGLGDDGGHRVHVGSQHVCVPAAGRTQGAGTNLNGFGFEM